MEKENLQDRKTRIFRLQKIIHTPLETIHAHLSIELKAIDS